MRFAVSALAAALLACASANAIPYIPPPEQVYEAPIDRALENVTAMEGIDPAQRAQLLGRLNLLAYARNDGAFAYMAGTHEFNEDGSLLCVDAPRPMRGAPEKDERTFGPNDLCARRDFNLGPNNELPRNVSAQAGSAALERLRAAERHYAHALELDPANLRARLGRAYALDRLARLGDARRELRRLIEIGLPRLAGPQSDWETHAVLTETAAHLSHLAVSRSDRNKVAQLRARLNASQPIMYVTPVFVPLSGAAFEALIDTHSSVAFDFAGTGDRRAQGWLTPDAAWLVWDPQGRGDVRSGFDLIGARTWSVFWRDGFEALAALDDDRSGDLTGAELGGLALWRDADRDGVSDAGEVAPVASFGIVSLATGGAPVREGLLAAPEGVRFGNGVVRPLYDWTPGLNDAAPVS